MLRRFWLRAETAFRQPAGAVVLAYHSVSDREFDPAGQAVRPDTFRSQVEFLKDCSVVVPAQEIAERVKRGQSVSGLSAITIDDGYSDNLSEALPIIETLCVPACVFVTVQPVSQTKLFWWDTLAHLILAPSDPAVTMLKVEGLGPLAIRTPSERKRSFACLHQWLREKPGSTRAAVLANLETDLCQAPSPPDVGRPMTIEELLILSSHPLVQIGAHTMTHPSLAALDSEEQRRELVESKKALTEILGRPVNYLAYPFGKPANVSDLTKKIAAEVGYSAAFTTMPLTVNRHSDPFGIPRLTVHEWPIEVFGRTVKTMLRSALH